jgi:hypothetical protein
MKLYRVKDWDKHFENNRTREIKHLAWIPLPTKQDGDGYAELVTEHADGASHYGAWVALVCIASKCDPRGTLLREPGRPHTPHSLARKSRLSAALFEAVLPRLLVIGWLEVIEAPQEGAVISREGAPRATRARTEQNRTEQNRTEQNRRKTLEQVKLARNQFEEIWKAYPRKLGKAKAEHLCAKLVKQGVDWTYLLSAAQHYAAAMRDKDAQYILHGSTFFAAKGKWTDYVTGDPEASMGKRDEYGNLPSDYKVGMRHPDFNSPLTESSLRLVQEGEV